jgi:hypothetical protein
MLTPYTALSISNEVEKFGAYAGFAAVLGLAVLALLYFASAREVKRLREWADRAPERVADLEARVGEMARDRAVAPQPVGQAAAAKQGAKPATAAAAAAAKPEVAGAAPNGAAEPAEKAEGEEQAKDAKPAPDDGKAAEGDEKPAVFDVTEAAPGDLTEVKKPAKGKKAQAGDQTLVSPGAGRALRQDRPSARPRPQAPVRPSTARLMESARASNAQRVAGAPPAAAKPPRAGLGRTTIALIGGGVAVLLVLALVVTGVIGGGGGDKPAAKNRVVPSTNSDTTAGGATVDRANTTVAVLNGTTIAGLASGVATQITDGGFKRGEVRNALDNTRAATIVEYTSGNKPAAVEVAKTIDVGTDVVQPVPEGTRLLAPTAQVIVTVGADQTPSTG